VTLESWMRIGAEDAKALQFFKDAGNEIIELSPDVQRQTKEYSIKWAEEQGKTNPWFKKVWENQRAFEKLWENAASYRNVRY
jgi:TRAP-type mannitol/chloroaromatic compound transport system substrate-binding protein